MAEQLTQDPTSITADPATQTVSPAYAHTASPSSAPTQVPYANEDVFAPDGK